MEVAAHIAIAQKRDRKNARRKKSNEPKVRRSFNAADIDSGLPDYDAFTEDLLDLSVTKSGGGANGTGKRR